MRHVRFFVFAVSIFFASFLTLSPVHAASCGNNANGFGPWLNDFKRRAASQGIPARAINASLKGVTYDKRVIRLDRSQKSFKLSFAQFYKRRVNNAMIGRGRKLMARHKKLFDGIERTYGVPASVIVAIWGLETGFGGNSGNMSVMRSLATLAYDCRRSEFFANELMSALTIVKRGDMAPSKMRGAWAGELGQTQFLASSYVKFAVDYDRNGRRDLINSVPDVLASTANYLKQHGWRRGRSWEPGSANYNVLFKWNRAKVYVQTISVMASKLGG